MAEEEQNTNTNGSDSSDVESANDVLKRQQEERQKEAEEEEVEFHAHKGKIMEIKPFTQISSISWDKSYDNPTGNSNVDIHYDDSERNELTKYIYKGASCKAKLRRSNEPQFTPTGIEEYGLSEESIKGREHYPTKEQLEEIEVEENREDLVNSENDDRSERQKAEDEAEENKPYTRQDGDGGIYGFITDVTHNDKGTELEIKDWGYCLEDNTKKLSFTSMQRSKILEEVIKSYGLVPVVDFTGLKDDSISWSNVTGGGSGSSSSNAEVGEASDGRTHCSPVLEVLSYNQNDGGGTPIDKLMQGFNPTEDALGKIGQADSNYGQAVSGKSPKEAYKVLKNGWKYCGYSNNRDKCATESFDNRSTIGLNCGDSARLLKSAMDVVGCPCCVLHVTHHYMNAVQINGEWKTADLCYSSGRHPEYNTAGFNK